MHRAFVRLIKGETDPRLLPEGAVEASFIDYNACRLSANDFVYLTFQTLINELWLSRGISEAIDAPRIHHTLFPNTVKTEYWPYNISQGIQDGLRARNHHVEARCGDAAVQAVARNEKKDIYGKCDPRKQSGWPAGF